MTLGDLINLFILLSTSVNRGVDSTFPLILGGLNKLIYGKYQNSAWHSQCYTDTSVCRHQEVGAEVLLQHPCMEGLNTFIWETEVFGRLRQSQGTQIMCGEVGFEPTLFLKPGLAHRITKRPNSECPSPGAGEVTGKLLSPRTPACRKRTRGERSTPVCARLRVSGAHPPTRPSRPASYPLAATRSGCALSGRRGPGRACLLRPNADSASAQGGALPWRLLQTEQRVAFVTCRPTFRAELGAGAQPRRPGSGLVRVGLKVAEGACPARRSGPGGGDRPAESATFAVLTQPRVQSRSPPSEAAAARSATASTLSKLHRVPKESPEQSRLIRCDRIWELSHLSSFGSERHTWPTHFPCPFPPGAATRTGLRKSQAEKQGWPLGRQTGCVSALLPAPLPADGLQVHPCSLTWPLSTLQPSSRTPLPFLFSAFTPSLGAASPCCPGCRHPSPQNTSEECKERRMEAFREGAFVLQRQSWVSRLWGLDF